MRPGDGRKAQMYHQLVVKLANPKNSHYKMQVFKGKSSKIIEEKMGNILCVMFDECIFCLGSTSQFASVFLVDFWYVRCSL